MGVDVATEIDIHLPVDEVSACAADPTNAPAWYDNIESVEWRTEPGVRLGAVTAFVAASSAGASLDW